MEKEKKRKLSEKEKKRKYLDAFGTNLTQKAREGKIDKLIGREKELESKSEQIRNIFNNYHLLDEIDLHEVILNSVSIDNTDLDLESEIKKIK